MALGMVQAGYRKALYLYTANVKTESEVSYDDWLAELTTELELAWKDGNEESVMDDENADEDSERTEAYSDRKKEWEELLEQSVVVEVMLRQMLENGLGQREDTQQENKKREQPEELDNEFNMAGVPDSDKGRAKDTREDTDRLGNSENLQRNAGKGAEHWSQTGAGRHGRPNHIFCLTCETECERKKQWKIVE